MGDSKIDSCCKAQHVFRLFFSGSGSVCLSLADLSLARSLTRSLPLARAPSPALARSLSLRLFGGVQEVARECVATD